MLSTSYGGRNSQHVCTKSGKEWFTHKLGRDTHERYGDCQQDETRPGVHLRLCLFELLLPA